MPRRDSCTSFTAYMTTEPRLALTGVQRGRRTPQKPSPVCLADGNIASQKSTKAHKAD